MSSTTTAAVVEAPGAGFTLTDVHLDGPRPTEARVRLVAAGLCHTDLGVAAGALPFPLPGVLGHEGAGIVEQVGDDVTRVAVGDHVLLSFTSCGACAACRDGHPAYCDTWLTANLIGGARPDGTSPVSRASGPIGGHFFGQSSFAREAIVDERSMTVVPADAELGSLAPLGCGVMTGVGAVWNVLRPRPGATLLVTGAGAVGLSAVLAARSTPAGRIVVVDRVPERLALARKLGATDTLDTSGHTDGGELTAAVTELTGGRGVDGLVETTGNAGVVHDAVLGLAARGTAALVGAPAFGTEVGVDVNFMIPGRSIVGVTLGDAETQTLLPVLVAMVRDGRLPIEELISHYRFEDIGTAVRDVVAGTAVKPVLHF